MDKPGRQQVDVFVILGATGDLARHMLLPSLYFLDAEGRLPEGMKVIGAARSAMSRPAFLKEIREQVEARAKPAKVHEDAWARFARRVHYVQADVAKPEGARKLKAELGEARLPAFYLALSPSLFEPVCEALKASGAATPSSRVVLEKPVGHDLESSRKVNAAVANAFSEDRVFRIDHYLGKETVQNLIALRFANTLFEPLWNNLAIDHVQITVAETVGVETRGDFYEQTGALRDMVPNHVFALVSMASSKPTGGSIATIDTSAKTGFGTMSRRAPVCS